jgi:cell division protein FtsN/nucleoid DNA-binding protein
MDIAARISELLFDYECVVLPEFGGFITNDKPAQINRITHQFKPPFREILFNVQLTANDGLLAKHISEKESISYKAAKQKIEEFVAWCRNELESGRRLEFAQIGSLTFDDSRNIVFEQDHGINYNPDSFGLDSLVSPAIKRVSQEEKIKGVILPVSSQRRHADRKAEHPSEEKKTKSKKPVYRFPLAIAGLLLLVILITSLFMPQQSSLISFAGLLPSSSTEKVTEVKPLQTQFQNTSPDKDLSLPGREAESKSAIETVESAEPTEDNTLTHPLEEIADNSNIDGSADKISLEAVEEPEPSKPTIDKIKPEIQPTGKQYYIIAGSFSEEKNAEKLIAQLAIKGYSALVADTNKNGMYRVAYAYYSSKADAKQQLLAIRQEENADAWLLRK